MNDQQQQQQPPRRMYAGRMRTLEAIERRREKNREWSYRMYWDDPAYQRRKLTLQSIRNADKTIAKYTELLEGSAKWDNLFVLPTAEDSAYS
jgi:hypothetical protein